MNRIMMAKGGTPALHLLGGIGRDVDDYIRVHDEDEEFYIGNFEEGLGFIDVKYKKSDVRSLTKEEVDDLNGKWYTINGHPMSQIYVDDEGNLV